MNIAEIRPSQTCRLMTGSLFIMLLLMLQPLWAVAAEQESERILDAPLAVPEALLKKMDTLRLAPEAGSGVKRYMARSDSQLLKDWLRSEGYLDAEIKVEMAEGEPYWRVHAGQLWRVHALTVTPEPYREITLPKPGDAFRSDDYDAAKARLLWAWRDAGYLKASYAKAVATPDHANKQIDITWQVELGPVFYISEIRIEAAKQYDATLPEQLSRLHAGEVPTQERLHDAMLRITSDSRYQHAIIVPELESAKGNQVPVRITVTEAGWRKLSGDAGYATDNGLTLGATWEDRSLFNGRIEYDLRAQYSSADTGFGATLIRPVWPRADQQVGISADFHRIDSDGRRYNSISGGPFWQWYFKGNDYLRLSLHGEQVRESGIKLLTVGPRADLHFARTRGMFLPTRGWRADIGLDLPVRLGSPGMWPLIEASTRLYWQPRPWLLASPRIGYGRTFNLQGTTPKTYLQFLGGANSVRGYALDSLGPLGTDGLATGGLMKTYGGLDLVLMPEAEWISPVLFADVGKLWQTIGTNAPVAWSFGGGVIVHTPAGPLRVDLAFPQRKRSQDSRFQLYISLGEVL